MVWTRSRTIALARETCTECRGAGLRLAYKSHTRPCRCVLRAIFRVCLERFRLCAESSGVNHTLCWEQSGRTGYRMYSRKQEEFMADFCIVARRALEPDDYRLLCLYFLGGADWRLCARVLGLDRGTLFHRVYRIEEVVGRAFVETEPYGLYPLDEYFGGVVRTMKAAAA